MTATRQPFWPLITLMVIVTILATCLGVVIFVVLGQTAHACTDRKNFYDALHGVIIKQNLPSASSPLILQRFPEFRPFFTPGTPEYREAKRIADTKRDAALAVLGDRPDC